MGLVGPLLDDEDEGVVVLDGLDGGLSAQRMKHDVEAIIGLLLHSSQDVLRGSLLSQSFWSSESSGGPDLALASLVSALLDSSGCFPSYGLIYNKESNELEKLGFERRCENCLCLLTLVPFGIFLMVNINNRRKN